MAQGTFHNVPANLRTDDFKKKFFEGQKITGEAEKAAAGYKVGLNNTWLMLRGGPIHVFKILCGGFVNLFIDDLEMFRWAQAKSHYRAIYSGDDHVFSDAVTRWANAAITAFYLLFVVTALVGVGSLKRAVVRVDAGMLFLVFSFLFFIAAHIPLKGQPRYHFSMMPLLLTLSAVGLRRLSTTPSP